MKAILLLLFISLISLYNSVERTVSCEEIINPINKNVCFNSTIREGYYKCCYEFYKILGMSYPSCVPLTKANYDNIDEYKKQRKSQIYNVKNYTLECETPPTPTPTPPPTPAPTDTVAPTSARSNSNYISLSLLSLIILLL